MIVHPTPNPQEVPPTILQHSYTKGTPCFYPQHRGSTMHNITTLIHRQSYNTHTLKGPPAPHSLSPAHRKHHPPSYNTLTTTFLQHSYSKGTPGTLPASHRKDNPPSYNTHTLKGPPAPHPLPPTHRKYHPPSYNTHTLKGPPPPYSQPTGSTTHHLTTLLH